MSDFFLLGPAGPGDLTSDNWNKYMPTYIKYDPSVRPQTVFLENHCLGKSRVGMTWRRDVNVSSHWLCDGYGPERNRNASMYLLDVFGILDILNIYWICWRYDTYRKHTHPFEKFSRHKRRKRGCRLKFVVLVAYQFKKPDFDKHVILLYVSCGHFALSTSFPNIWGRLRFITTSEGAIAKCNLLLQPTVSLGRIFAATLKLKRGNNDMFDN